MSCQHGQQTIEDLLQPQGVLERDGRHQTTGYRTPRFLKKSHGPGLPNKPCGKFTSPGHATSLDPSSMSRCPMPCTKPRGKKAYKYALTVVDVASRYKDAEALTSKDSNEVASGFAKIYRRGPLKWPQMLQVDPGREFMGALTKAMENNKTVIRRGRPNIHRNQGIVERFNRTLAERLFGHQYAVEMNMPSGRSTAWVKRFPEVVSALNNEVTRLIGKKPADAIREKAVASKPATPYTRPVGTNERKLPPQAHVRYLYYPGELEGGGRRATDPIWSLKVYNIQKVVTKPEAPVVYYLLAGPKRGFVREELMVVPPGTVLPPVDYLH